MEDTPSGRFVDFVARCSSGSDFEVPGVDGEWPTQQPFGGIPAQWTLQAVCRCPPQPSQMPPGKLVTSADLPGLIDTLDKQKLDVCFDRRTIREICIRRTCKIIGEAAIRRLQCRKRIECAGHVCIEVARTAHLIHMITQPDEWTVGRSIAVNDRTVRCRQIEDCTAHNGRGSWDKLIVALDTRTHLGSRAECVERWIGRDNGPFGRTIGHPDHPSRCACSTTWGDGGTRSPVDELYRGARDGAHARIVHNEAGSTAWSVGDSNTDRQGHEGLCRAGCSDV